MLATQRGEKVLLANRYRIRRVAVAAALGGLVLAHPGAANAQRGSGIQLSPQSNRYFISKDVGPERWAITYNLDDDSVTGNVFFRDERPPQFVWCERIGDNGDPDPQTVEISFDCYGADACADGDCGGDDWTLIAGSLRLPGSFFVPQAVSPCGDPISGSAGRAAASACP